MAEGPQKRDHLCTRLVDGLLLTIGSGLVNRSILTAGSTSSRFVSFFAFHSFTQPPTQWPDTLGYLKDATLPLRTNIDPSLLSMLHLKTP